MKHVAWWDAAERVVYERALGALWRFTTIHRDGPHGEAVIKWVEPCLVMVTLDALGWERPLEGVWEACMEARLALSSRASVSDTPYQLLALRDVVRGCEELLRGLPVHATRWVREAEEQMAYAAILRRKRELCLPGGK